MPTARCDPRPEPRTPGAASPSSNVSAGTRVYLSADRLPAVGDYEVWCVRTDGRWISGGSFRPSADGAAEATLTAAVEPGEYHEVVVTRRGSEGARGAEVLRGKLVY